MEYEYWLLIKDGGFCRFNFVTRYVLFFLMMFVVK